MKKYKQLIIDELVFLLIGILLTLATSNTAIRIIVVINLWILVYYLFIFATEHGWLPRLNDKKTVTPGWLYLRNIVLSDLALILPILVKLLVTYINKGV